MANEKFTQLPTVTNALMADIIAVVQGGVSSQETLQQVATLFLANVILHNAGNPNGSVAGVVYQLCWDTTNHILYVCTTSGNAATAVWTTEPQLVAGPGISISFTPTATTISGTGSGIGWTEVIGTTQAMAADSGYVANNAGVVTLTLPATAAFGTAISIIGKGAGGWSIAQNALQVIQVGSLGSTAGIGGSVSSTNRYDSIELICTTANTVWTVIGGVQGNLTIV